MQSFLDGDFLSRFEHIVYDAEARSRYVEEEKLPKSVHKGVSLFHGHRAGSPELKVTVKVREKKAFASWDTQDAWLRNMNAFLSRRYYSPYVAQVYECLHDEQNYYMVMERVPGPDLWQYLHTVVKVSEDHTGSSLNTVKYYLLQAALGLRDLLDHGFFHKDVKCENIIVATAETTSTSTNENNNKQVIQIPRLKLIDFDTCECVDNCYEPYWVLGTDQYIAPEVYKGHYSNASEVLSLGVILYRVLTNQLPFPREIYSREKPGDNYVNSEKSLRILQGMRRFQMQGTLVGEAEKISNRFSPDTVQFLKRCLAVEKWQNASEMRSSKNKLTRLTMPQLPCCSWFDSVRERAAKDYLQWRKWDETTTANRFGAQDCGRSGAYDNTRTAGGTGSGGGATATANSSEDNYLFVFSRTATSSRLGPCLDPVTLNCDAAKTQNQLHAMTQESTLVLPAGESSGIQQPLGVGMKMNGADVALVAPSRPQQAQQHHQQNVMNAVQLAGSSRMQTTPILSNAGGAAITGGEMKAVDVSNNEHDQSSGGKCPLSIGVAYRDINMDPRFARRSAPGGFINKNDPTTAAATGTTSYVKLNYHYSPNPRAWDPAWPQYNRSVGGDCSTAARRGTVGHQHGPAPGQAGEPGYNFGMGAAANWGLSGPAANSHANYKTRGGGGFGGGGPGFGVAGGGGKKGKGKKW